MGSILSLLLINLFGLQNPCTTIVGIGIILGIRPHCSISFELLNIQMHVLNSYDIDIDWHNEVYNGIDFSISKVRNLMKRLNQVLDLIVFMIWH